MDQDLVSDKVAAVVAGGMAAARAEAATVEQAMQEAAAAGRAHAEVGMRTLQSILVKVLQV